jgi:hypothetical protein
MSHVNKTYNVGPVEIVVENKVVEEIVWCCIAVHYATPYERPDWRLGTPQYSIFCLPKLYWWYLLRDESVVW